MRPGVLIVGNFLSSHGGSRGVCEELAPRLADRHFPIVTTSNKRNRALRLADMLSVIWNARHDYQVAQVDVYSGPAFFWAETAVRLLRLLGKPIVVTLHGGGLPEFASKHARRVRSLLSDVALVTVPSQYLLEQMSGYRSDLLLIPNAVDTSSYRFRVRRPLRPNLIWLRAFHAIYAPEIVPKVIASVKKNFSSVHVTMVGPDKGDGSLERTLAAADAGGIREHITVCGPVPKANVPAMLDEGDIFLNTARFDNTPVSVVEAMAAGTCIVSTRVGGIPYLLSHEQDALLVPVDDFEAIATAVQRLLTDRELSSRLQSNAAQKAANFDWNNVLPRWETLLTSVAQRGSVTKRKRAVQEGERLV